MLTVKLFLFRCCLLSLFFYSLALSLSLSAGIEYYALGFGADPYFAIHFFFSSDPAVCAFVFVLIFELSALLTNIFGFEFCSHRRTAWHYTPWKVERKQTNKQTKEHIKTTRI